LDEEDSREAATADLVLDVGFGLMNVQLPQSLIVNSEITEKCPESMRFQFAVYRRINAGVFAPP